MLLSKITQKGQVTIPKKIRDTLNLNANDQVVFVLRGDDVIIKPVRDVLKIRGTVENKEDQNYVEERKKTREKTAERIANE